MASWRTLAAIGSLIFFVLGLYALIALSKYGMHHDLSAWTILGLPGISVLLSLVFAAMALSDRLRNLKK